MINKDRSSAARCFFAARLASYGSTREYSATGQTYSKFGESSKSIDGHLLVQYRKLVMGLPKTIANRVWQNCTISATVLGYWRD